MAGDGRKSAFESLAIDFDKNGTGSTRSGASILCSDFPTVSVGVPRNASTDVIQNLRMKPPQFDIMAEYCLLHKYLL